MIVIDQSVTWRRASRCESGACVEVARVGDQIAIRDSKDAAGPVLLFTQEEWSAFTRGVRDGDLTYLD